jgi:hypothetical protein
MTYLVLFAGGPLDMTWERTDMPGTHFVVWGQYQGDYQITDVVEGDHFVTLLTEWREPANATTTA